MSKHNNFIVITGGPGAGKTTLLHELGRRGYGCVEEVARQLIAEQIRDDGQALPWKDKALYTQMMLERSVSAYRQAPTNDTLVFFDRGIPDSICYATLQGLLLTDEMQHYARVLRYHKTVFLLPPWQAIYHTDTERKQDWSEAVSTYTMMKQTYLDYQYELVEIPEAPVGDRADFLLKTLAASGGT